MDTQNSKTPFYKSKPFWTFVSSLIAALSAYFLTSCAYSGKFIRSGLHHDTVKIEYRLRSNNSVI